MAGRKAFLENPKHQYCVSKCGEQDCRAHNEESGDYNEYPISRIKINEYPSLSHFTDEN